MSAYGGVRRVAFAPALLLAFPLSGFAQGTSSWVTKPWGLGTISVRPASAEDLETAVPDYNAESFLKAYSAVLVVIAAKEPLPTGIWRLFLADVTWTPEGGQAVTPVWDNPDFAARYPKYVAALIAPAVRRRDGLHAAPAAPVVLLVPLPRTQGPGVLTVKIRSERIEPSLFVYGGTSAWTFPLTLPSTEEAL